MTEDQRRKLEEMASQYAKSTGWVPKLVTDKDYIEDPFMAGASAAFDMATSQRVLSDDAHWSAGYRAGKEEATKAERERIALLLEGCASSVPRSITIKIFNPTTRVEGEG
jgi:hypothetical protein